ncbi:hypothetical protein AGMMS49983_09250 [Clostridia bacterium]|nr:hypothetical protein AGMMS49983_09250 [Clostridia bacterium]
MSGFQNPDLNLIYADDVYEKLITHLLFCCEKMVLDYHGQHKFVENNENKMRNRLLEEYLNAITIGVFYFQAEAPENYDHNTAAHSRRIDIKVISSNIFSNSKDYYTIECKRVDGQKTLNEKYIEEGVARFVVPPIGYPSYHQRNIMLGFVVSNIDIQTNTDQIKGIQSAILRTYINSDLTLLRSDPGKYFIYLSSYRVNADILNLHHIFYDFSSIIHECRIAENF